MTTPRGTQATKYFLATLQNVKAPRKKPIEDDHCARLRGVRFFVQLRGVRNYCFLGDGARACLGAGGTVLD